MSRDDVFYQKLRQFEGLIHYASERMSIPGVVDEEDSFQEALLILDKMFSKYSWAHPDSDDFRKLFKTELWHGLSKLVTFHKWQKRDWRKLVRSPPILENIQKTRTREAVSEDGMTYDQHASRADEFLDHLIDRLDDDQTILLFELLHPRDMPEEMKVRYKRIPSRASYSMLAEYLGLDVNSIRKALFKIREEASDLARLYDIGDYSRLVRA